jgi:hypothetical protein
MRERMDRDTAARINRLGEVAHYAKQLVNSLQAGEGNTDLWIKAITAHVRNLKDGDLDMEYDENGEYIS